MKRTWVSEIQNTRWSRSQEVTETWNLGENFEGSRSLERRVIPATSPDLPSAIRRGGSMDPIGTARCGFTKTAMTNHV